MTNSTECRNLNDVVWEINRELTTKWTTIILFTFLYSIIIIFGVFGNSCVILSIPLQTVPNFFIASLSCSDIVVCLTSATITPFTAFAKVWIFGSLLCAVLPQISGVGLFFSTFTLTAISIDRFILIVFPTRPPIRRRHAHWIIILILTMAIALSTPIALHQSVVKFDRFCGVFCVEQWEDSNWGRRTYGGFSLVLQFLVPLLIISVCYTFIFLKIADCTLPTNQGMLTKKQKGSSLHASQQRLAAMKRRQRTNRMLISMVVAFASSWAPYVVFNLTRDYELWPLWVNRQQYLYGVVTHCIAMTSTVWNPLLYAWLNPQLRTAFVGLLHCTNLETRSMLNKRRHQKRREISLSVKEEHRLDDILL